jgi:hypothetical protein
MSEKAPNPQPQEFKTVDLQEYKNGSQHLYEVAQDGKKLHISEDSLLQSYGIDPSEHVVSLAENKALANGGQQAADQQPSQPTAWDRRLDSKIAADEAQTALEDATTRFHTKNGRGKFDAARDMEKAQKNLDEANGDHKKADQKAKVENNQWGRRTKVVSDYQELMEKQTKEGPDYKRTAEEDKIIELYDDLEASQKKLGKPLSELVTDDDVRYYRQERDAENEAAKAKKKKDDPANDLAKLLKLAEKAKRDEQNKEKYDRYLYHWRNARDQYARMSAGRGRRRFRFGQEFNKDAVAAARRAYEKAENILVKHEAAMALTAGVTGPELVKVYASAAAESQWGLANALDNYRMVDAGRAQWDDNTRDGVTMIQPKTSFGKLANKFYDWLGGQSKGKFFSRSTPRKAASMGGKAAAMVGIGAAGSVLLGPIAGGALGALVATKITRRAYNLTHHSEMQDAIQHQIMKDTPRVINALKDVNALEDVTRTIDGQTVAEVARNRRRLVGAVGSVALGALANPFTV